MARPLQTWLAALVTAVAGAASEAQVPAVALFEDPAPAATALAATETNLLNLFTVTEASREDHFGSAVAIDADTLVVGVPQDTVPVGSRQGSAYVYVRSGKNWNKQARLQAIDGQSSEKFGVSVAIDGDTIVVGATFYGGAQHGAAYVFVRSGSTWTQQARLLPADPAQGNYFGCSVAVDVDTVVVGAFGGVYGSGKSGAAYVFTRTGAAWTQQAKLVAGDPEADAQFGASVAVSGDTVAIGAPDDNGPAGFSQGAVYLFTRNGVAWSQQLKLMPADAAAYDWFGRSVAMEPGRLAVGAYSAGVPSGNQGAVYVFTGGGAAWSQQARIVADVPVQNEQLGVCVGLSGNVIVAGTSPYLVENAAYVFAFDGVAWSQTARFTDPGTTTYSNFGYAIGVSGTTCVVGAPYEDGTVAMSKGVAFVFAKAGGTGGWDQQARLELAEVGDLAGGDQFGQAVSIDGDTAVVGAGGETGPAGFAQGSAYVFVRGAGGWSVQARLLAEDGQAHDWFGVSVGISGETIVVGAPWGGSYGGAYVFVRSGTTWTQQARPRPSVPRCDFFAYVVKRYSKCPCFCV